MAEGIVLGILGLIPLCKDGYIFIQNVVKAPEAAGNTLLRFELQSQVFDEWAERWERISKATPSKAATSEESARRIFRQITAISVLLYDARSLRDKYKLKEKFKLEWDKSIPATPDPSMLHLGDALDEDAIAAFKSSCKENMKFIQKCKYALSGDAKWKDMIAWLKEYNDNLYLLGLGGTPILLATSILPNDRMNGTRLIEAVSLEVESPGPLREKYGQVLAVLRARCAEQPTELQCEGVWRGSPHIEDEYYKLRYGKRKVTATMARLRKGNKRYATLVEWTNLEPNDAARTSLLLNRLSSELTLLPTSFGIAEGMGPGGRHGILLGLPKQFGILTEARQKGEISKIRQAQNVREMIREQPKGLTVRLRIAQRLASAVHAIHVAQFVHKNIRSSIILFFPKLDQELEHPMITGFNHSHHKEIFEQVQNEAEDSYASSNDEQGKGDDPQTKAQQHDIRLDYYQHPDKHKNPKLHYQARHDLYSLACVLLEIGLWKTMRRAIKDLDKKKNDSNKGKTDWSNPDDVKEGIVEWAGEESLDQHVGQIYGDFVRQCLNMDADKFSLERERELVERLRSCHM